MRREIKKYENLIHKRAIYFHRFNQEIPLEDLKQEAFLAYAKANEKFDASKGVKFISYLWKTINSQLIRYISQWKKWNLTVSSIEPEPTAHNNFSLDDCWKKFTSETREIINLVLSNPLEFMDGLPAAKQKKRIQKMTGLPNWKINQTFAEIRKIL